MSVEVRPFGVSCNLQCEYCYQNPMRESRASLHYSLPELKRALELEGRPFTLFGGEPLLMRLEDLESLFSWGLDRYGENTVQTNGTLITAKHIEIFRRYKVRVGISIDGPDELNDARWAGSLANTRAATERTNAAIVKLCEAGMAPGLIVTLHRKNATASVLPRLCRWLEEMDRIGVKSIRLHLLESENEEIRAKYGLTAAENLVALLKIMELEGALRAVRFDVFQDIRHLLAGEDGKCTCVWRACDPYTTQAVTGIESVGHRSNCSRTNKEGVDFIKGSRVGFERYLALYHTPQQYGGCSGCRFFLMCKGQCPGTAVANDWRNRTEHCEVWKKLFEVFESKMLGIGQPVLSSSIHRGAMEDEALRRWQEGTDFTLEELVRSVAARSQAASPPSSTDTGGKV